MVSLRHILIPILWLTATLSAAEPGKDTIRINEPDWPPFFYPNRPLGQKAGIAKDIIDICLGRMHRGYEYVPLPIERMQKEMQDGTLDINFFSYKKDRESFVTFGKELAFKTGYRPVIKKGSSVSIQSIADFDRYRLGHTIGLRYSPEFLAYIQKRKKADDLDETPSIESNLRKVIAGRIDVFVADASSILTLAADMKLTDQIQVLDFPIHDGLYYVSLSSKSPRFSNHKAFAEDFDRCLADLKKQGTYCAIFQNYQLPCVLK